MNRDKYMHHSRAPLLCRLILPLAAVLLHSSAQAQAPVQAFAGSGQTPQFTADQAGRGKAAYAGANCGRCHGESLEGNGSGPALADPAFKAQWRDLKPTALFSYMAAKMPMTAPGSLSKQEYQDLTAFVFQQNGFAPGTVAFEPSAESAEEAAAPLPKMERQDAASQAVKARRQALLNQLSPVTDDTLRHPVASDWLMWRGGYAGWGYSSLRQIDKKTVKTLTLSAARSLPLSSNEITPLVHDGVMFIKSGSHVLALDAVTGDQLWEYVRPYPAWMHDGATEIVKNIAIYGDRIYVPFLDGHLLALDMKTGKVVWDHEIISAAEAVKRLPGGFPPNRDPQRYLMVADGGPMVAKGEVIIGMSGCSRDYKGGCFIVGMNASTGAEDWRFNTIARPGEPGGDSWNGAPVDERYGASVWFSGTYDPDLDLVYFGVGQTYHLSTLLTPQAGSGESNDALYTDSTLALKPQSGKLAWYYQHFNGDVWDLDWAFERTLLTVPVKGERQNVVVTGGKIGIFDVLERGTGQYLFSYTLGMQNIVTAIDPVTGKKSIDPRFKGSPPDFLRKSGQAYTAPTKLCPYARVVPSTAVDPTTRIMYIPVLDASCADPDKKFDGMLGRMEAVDVATGKPLWIQRHQAPDASSALATAGGVVIGGTLDRRFTVYDSANGTVLWEVHLDNAPKATPVTYSVHGKQYIAVVSGGEQQNFTGWAQEAPTTAETLWIFGLPDVHR